MKSQKLNKLQQNTNPEISTSYFFVPIIELKSRTHQQRIGK